MLEKNISESTMRTGTIYIGDIGKATGTLEVTGGILKAEARILEDRILEIDITIEESNAIPLMFFSIKNVSDNADTSDIAIVMLKNQTSSNARIQISKNNTETTDITLSVFIIKPWLT